jgi:TetR/AcrR family transcriptional regulator, regulator of cefoperazone and chloramphenicol sensitivity
MLNMRSVDDVTARARIRDAAIELFGRDGFERTTVRAIARAAGVSPALVVHHFTSKERLRKTCEEHLLTLVREGKAEALGGQAPPSLEAYLATVEDSGPLLRYLTRTLQEGGAAASRIFTGLVDDTVDYLAASESAGVVRPTQDARARATALVSWGLSNLLLGRLIAQTFGDEYDEAAALARVAGPALEIYTDGLFTDSRFLDAFRGGQEQHHDKHDDHTEEAR